MLTIFASDQGRLEENIFKGWSRSVSLGTTWGKGGIGLYIAEKRVKANLKDTI